MEPVAKSLDEQPGVQRCNDDGDDPGENFIDRAVHELAHLHFVAREHDEREDSEAQLQTQDHLAEDEQIGGALFAGNDSSR